MAYLRCELGKEEANLISEEICKYGSIYNTEKTFTTEKDYKKIMCTGVSVYRSTSQPYTTPPTITIQNCTPELTIDQGGGMNNAAAALRVSMYKDVPSGSTITFTPNSAASTSNAIVAVGFY